MISSLNGQVELIDIPYVIINVNGVGYRVLVSNTVLSGIEQDKSVKLFTYTYVREDALELFGFSQYQDLKLFEALISVSGIGPKTAIGAFSVGTGADIMHAIQEGDVNYFTKVPRLGKKNAQKIIIELKNKMGGTVDLDLTDGDIKSNGDLAAALTGFGYSPQEVQLAIKGINGQGTTIQEKIKLALKYLGR